MKKCIGFGEKEGKCSNKVNKKINPYWCPECDKKRIEFINKSLQEISNSFKNKN